MSPGRKAELGGEAQTIWFYAAAFKWQILMGAMLGAACAVTGVFVLLQRLTVFGIALSQAAVCAAVITLIAGWHASAAAVVPLGDEAGHASFGAAHTGDLVALGLTVLFMLPFYVIRLRGPRNQEAVLAVGLVSFAALAQVLLAVGGDVKNHIVQAFFGNIVTAASEEFVGIFIPGLIASALIIVYYRGIVAVSFDRDHARLSGASAIYMDLIFFLVLCWITAVTIRLMGSFYMLAHLIIPGVAALAASRSIKTTILLAACFSVFSTVFGFFLSFYPLPIGGGLNLPTSGTIILCMTLFLFLVLGLNRLRGRHVGDGA